ncbi:MAG: hypothetical protein ACYC6S_05830 [Desulfobulbia bacterium]
MIGEVGGIAEPEAEAGAFAEFGGDDNPALVIRGKSKPVTELLSGIRLIGIQKIRIRLVGARFCGTALIRRDISAVGIQQQHGDGQNAKQLFPLPRLASAAGVRRSACYDQTVFLGGAYFLLLGLGRFLHLG